METDNNDILIRAFMQENKHEIPDFHFSNKVMASLPGKKQYDWILIVATGLGCLLSLLLVWNGKIPEIVITLPGDINYWYLIGAVFSLPLIIGAIYALIHYRIIRIF